MRAGTDRWLRLMRWVFAQPGLAQLPPMPGRKAPSREDWRRGPRATSSRRERAREGGRPGGHSAGPFGAVAARAVHACGDVPLSVGKLLGRPETSRDCFAPLADRMEAVHTVSATWRKASAAPRSTVAAI